MYKIELLVLLCLVSAFIGMCLCILFNRYFKRNKFDGSLPIAKNVRIIMSREISDVDMMMAIINLSRMKFEIDKLQKIDKREEFKKMLNEVIDEVYDDRQGTN